MSIEAWAIQSILKYELQIDAGVGRICAGGFPTEIFRYWEMDDTESFYRELAVVVNRRQQQLIKRGEKL